MKKLSTKERLGAAALAAVSLGFVASAFILRGCRGDVAASSVAPVQDPVAVYSSDSIPGEYEAYEDDADMREGKKRKKRKTAKRQKKNKSRKRHDDRGNKADSASSRDFLKEPVPVRNRPDR